jgi:tetratricopeptide (TPR) repeat protein
VLDDTERELRAYGGTAPPSLVYTLREVRTEAQEIVHGIDEALGELYAALDVLPEDARYLRTKAWAAVARLLADKYEWEEAHAALNTADSEVTSSTDVDDAERRRCEAILKLVRANIHQSLGEDDTALRYYEECASVLEELDEVAFAVSALQGFVDCETYLLHDPPDRTVAHLSDLARDSQEHRRITDLERQGIAHLAEGDPARGNLAAARDLLARAEAAAMAVHSLRSIRRVRIWYADVLREAELPHEALVAYVVAGEREKAIEVAAAVRDEWPAEGNNSASLFDELLEVASKGPIVSRGPAFVALKELWDLLPDETLSGCAKYLSKLDEFNSSVWADREVLSYAADLAYTLAPRLDDAQSRNVATAVVAAIRRDDVYFTAHKNACRALARFVNTHPAIIDELDVPTERLADMASRDVDNDRLCDMTALVNLALAGQEEAETEALRLLEDAHPFTRVRWRQVLGIATEGELAETIREWLPRSVSRAQPTEVSTSISIGWVNPMFLSNWRLPESVKSEVALALSEAVTDSTVLLHHRQAAAVVLGLKAEQFEEQDVTRVVDALIEVLTPPFEAEDVVRSIDNPVSMLRMYLGEADAVIAAAAESLLAFSGRFDDTTKRARVLQKVGKLRVGHVEPIGLGVADGLRYFSPRSSDEEWWLRIRLLRLLESHHSTVRQSAARSLALLVESDALSFDAEILATVLFLAEEPAVGDRAAAARVLSRMNRNSHWVRPAVENSLRTLRGDPSYLVRSRADENP